MIYKSNWTTCREYLVVVYKIETLKLQIDKLFFTTNGSNKNTTAIGNYLIKKQMTYLTARENEVELLTTKFYNLHIDNLYFTDSR